MTKYTQKQLRSMVKDGTAIDATNFTYDDVNEPLKHIGWSKGIYGCNGALLLGTKTKRLYAITARTPALFRFT